MRTANQQLDDSAVQYCEKLGPLARLFAPSPVPGSRASYFAEPISPLPELVPARQFRCERARNRKLRYFCLFEAIVIVALIWWRIMDAL